MVQEIKLLKLDLSNGPADEHFFHANNVKLKAIVLTPSAVNQIPITGHPPKKKCRLRELLKLAY